VILQASLVRESRPLADRTIYHRKRAPSLPGAKNVFSNDASPCFSFHLITPNTKMETGPAKLEKLMASCEHGIWGFVIYRSAYGPDSDTDFSAFIQHLKELVAEYDEIYGKHPILRETDVGDIRGSQSIRKC
jgi:hypothetical protein